MDSLKISGFCDDKVQTTAEIWKLNISNKNCKAIKEYTFHGRECKSTGIGKIEGELFMSHEEIFIPRLDSCLAEVWQLSSWGQTVV